MCLPVWPYSPSRTSLPPLFTWPCSISFEMTITISSISFALLPLPHKPFCSGFSHLFPRLPYMLRTQKEKGKDHGPSEGRARRTKDSKRLMFLTLWRTNAPKCMLFNKINAHARTFCFVFMPSQHKSSDRHVSLMHTVYRKLFFSYKNVFTAPKEQLHHVLYAH